MSADGIFHFLSTDFFATESEGVDRMVAVDQYLNRSKGFRPNAGA
jgi:hypothetical protein